jgi:acetylornithine deacetylase/succinyl-diaminopimelate desuccinylase-like protein
MARLQSVLDHADTAQDQALERLFQLLKIQSISTDPAYQDQCRDAADWLVNDLAGIGIDARRHDTPGHPMVMGASKPVPDKPTLLFYGHYDVQPVDPIALWHRDPFDPMLDQAGDNTVIRARGAADDKGQLMTFVEACRAWVAVHGELPCQIRFLFEGEEESGSPSLIPFLKAHAADLTADLALVCDTGMWDANTPAICTMLRGMLGEEITITGPDKDLHSGMYGGPARNPIRVLADVLAGLHDENGRVTLDGFYDDVPELPAQLQGQWSQLNFDETAFLGAVGLAEPAGEKQYSALEQIWSRPTCEFNGITGGYTGEGFKTVLPSTASTKISFRLTGQQDPHKIRESLHQYIESKCPPDCTVTYQPHGASPATVMSIDNPAFKKAQQALSEEWQNDAVYVGSGGSIPVVGDFQQYLGMESMLVGFGLDDDQIHSPNEKYDLRSFQKGINSWIRILDALTHS